MLTVPAESFKFLKDKYYNIRGAVYRTETVCGKTLLKPHLLNKSFKKIIASFLDATCFTPKI